MLDKIQIVGLENTSIAEHTANNTAQHSFVKLHSSLLPNYQDQPSFMNVGFVQCQLL